SRPVPDGEGAYSVIWSPDGQTLLFDAKGKLRRVGVNASVSQVISDSSPYSSSAIPFGADRLLVCNHRNCGVIASSGGPPHPIDQWYSWAQLLPGGRSGSKSLGYGAVGPLANSALRGVAKVLAPNL